MVVAKANSPYNLKLGNYYWKVAQDPQSSMLMWKRNPIPFFPSRITSQAASQTQFPPEARVPYSFAEHGGGYGLSRIDGTEGTQVSRYFYTTSRSGYTDEGVDCSLGTSVTLSGKVNRITLPSTPTGSNPKFIPYNNSLYLIGGQYIYKMGSGYAWTQVADLGAGVTATDAAVFRGTQTTSYLFLACGSGTSMRYSTDGTSFAAVPSGAQAERLVKINNRLYRFLDGETWYATDGVVAGAGPTFSGRVQVGDNVGTCNGLYNHSDRIVIGKSCGLFLLASDTDTLDQNLHPELWNNGADADTFSQGVNFRNNLIIKYKQGLASYNPSFNYAEVGPNEILDNLCPATGIPSAMAADNYHVYWTLPSGWIIKGVPTIQSGSVVKVTPHTYLNIGTTAVTAMGIWGGTTGSDPQLYWLQGTQVGRVILSTTGNQKTDSRYQYCAGGVLYEPSFYAGFTQEKKLLLSFSVDADNLSGTCSIQHGYKALTEDSYTELTGNLQTQSPGSRVDISTPPFASCFWTSATLVSQSSTSTPLLRSHTISYIVTVDPVMQMVIGIDLTEGAMLDDGSYQRISPDVASARLEAMINAGILRLIDPWGRVYDVTVPLDGFDETGGGNHVIKVPDLFVMLKVVSQKQRTRGTFAFASTLTFNALKVYKFNQTVTL